MDQAKDYPHITSRCFVNAPFYRLQRDIDRFIENRIQPEIGLEGDVLYERSIDDFQEIGERLRNAGLFCTIHAPFYELSPGAIDPHIRRVSREKLKKAFELIPVFRPKSIVCHLGFEENKHGYKEKDWFKYSLDAWRELLEMAAVHQTPLMLENTYEKSPEQHRRMLSALDSPLARFCLDVGHILAFAGNSWQDWLPELSPWLGQLHLHDNHGGIDEHLAVGQGLFDFRNLFCYLQENKLKPLITLEPHHELGLEESLPALDQLADWSDSSCWPGHAGLLKPTHSAAMSLTQEKSP